MSDLTLTDLHSEADLNDIQFLISFNREALAKVVKGDAINFTKTKSLDELEEDSDIRDFVISTADQDSLVNMNYSLLDQGKSLKGSIELIDNNLLFFNYVNQGIVGGDKVTFYVLWGYGRNRYHWSLVHKVFITDINYNLHEGHKVVNLHFTATDLIGAGGDRFQIVTSTPIKKPKQVNLVRYNQPSTLRQIAKSIAITLGGNEIDENPKTILETQPIDRIQVIADIIEKAARATFQRGRVSNENIKIDKEKLIDDLRSRDEGAIYGVKDPDIYWAILADSIGGLDYQPYINPTDFGGKYTPGSLYSRKDTIIPRGDHLIQYQTEIENNVKKLQEELVTLKRRYSEIEKKAQQQLFINTSEGKRIRQRIRTEIPAEIATERAKIQKIYENMSFNEDFPVLTYYKPHNVPNVEYFQKFLNSINYMFGLNLRYYIDDTKETPLIVIAQTAVEAQTKGVDLIAANTNKKLYNRNTGLRRITSVNPKGKRLLENPYTGELNLVYNDFNSIIQKATVDIQYFEFLNWVDRIIAFPKGSATDSSDYELFDLPRMVELADIIKQYYKQFTNVSQTNDPNIKKFLEIVQGRKTEGFQKIGAGIELNTTLAKSVEEFLQRNKSRLVQTIARDFSNFQLKFVTVQLAMPGIPELDEAKNLYYGRAVNLEIFDPSPTKDKTKIEFLSGRYYIKGIKHEILIGQGYTTYLTLFKAVNEDLFLTGKEEPSPEPVIRGLRTRVS